MSEEQLADVLRHIRMDRRAFVRRAVLGSAFAVPVVASFPMGTALGEGSPGCGTANGSPGYLADLQLQRLGERVQGVGPGKSLANKVATARQHVAACDFDAAIGVLEDFIAQVSAQRGKKLDPATADELIEDAERIIGELRRS